MRRGRDSTQPNGDLLLDEGAKSFVKSSNELMAVLAIPRPVGHPRQGAGPFPVEWF